MTADRLFSVQDRVVVVTGGLGRLGRRFASALVERGARVAIFDVGVDRPRPGGWTAERVMVVEADVTAKASLEAALAQVTSAWEVPFGLVNNAALDSPPQAPIEENGPFESYPESSWDRVMEVNVKGVFLASQVVGGAMARAGRGSIINISSIYGLVSPDQRIYEYRRQQGQEFYKPVAYSASKSALLNLTRYLATYWSGRGVRVNTMTLAGVAAGQDEAFMKGYLQKVPLGRMAAEDEYDGALVFLLSEASRYMTGANLVVDGGWTAW
ncbi:MAG TPA: SDR family oxidoreductase [Polyangia bacterium]|nr:SDR family oxidoreductase [Polyangia bacterium]